MTEGDGIRRRCDGSIDHALYARRARAARCATQHAAFAYLVAALRAGIAAGAARLRIGRAGARRA